MLASTAAVSTVFWVSLAGMAVAAEPDGSHCSNADATPDRSSPGGGAFGQPNGSGHSQGGLQGIGWSHGGFQIDSQGEGQSIGDGAGDGERGDQGDQGDQGGWGDQAADSGGDFIDAGGDFGGDFGGDI
jgi:hypothetical protein